MRPVLFAPEVEDDLFRLTGLLVDQGYFSDFGYANEYIEDLVRFIVENIDISPSKPAPFVFSKGNPNVRYIIFQEKISHNMVYYFYGSCRLNPCYIHLKQSSRRTLF